MFKNISDGELISQTKRLVREERAILARLLEHLEEIERRGLHFKMKYTSMFDFCQRELAYSKDEAFVRISAMRLSRQVPEVVQAIEEGRLLLSNAVKAQNHFKNALEVTLEEKRDVLKQLEGLTTREADKVLKPNTRAKKTFEVDDEILADLKRIRELWGNQDLSDKELLRKIAKLVLAKIDPELKAGLALKKSVGAQRVAAQQVVSPELPLDSTLTPPPEMITPETRYIPAHVRAQIWKRDEGRCTFKQGDQRCESRYALQFDHLILYSHGGSHAPENLRLLCRAHHRMLSVA